MKLIKSCIDVKKIAVLFLISIFVSFSGCADKSNDQNNSVVALWLFDDQVGLYPSSVITECVNDNMMVLGLGGQIVEGKFGNAIEPIEYPEIILTEGSVKFGLSPTPKQPGRKVEPMTLATAKYCALMTRGENHLRKLPEFKNATETKLNLGSFDWTIEFWNKATKESEGDGIIFEIGEGPRGENDHITQLYLNADSKSFTLVNQPSNTKIKVFSDEKALSYPNQDWHHLAFVYSFSEKQLKHFVDGKLQPIPEKCELKSLQVGAESYFTICRDGLFNKPLPGRIDELRFLSIQVYKNDFTPPGSFSELYSGKIKPYELKKGLPLLFAKKPDAVVELGNRKYLFIDDAIVSEQKNITYNVNPARLAERVIERIPDHFTKHLNIVEDEKGLLRIYYEGPDDKLAVITSTDGINWKMPDVGLGEYKGAKNIVVYDKVRSLGNVFIDPNGPDNERWKMVSGIDGSSIYLYTSPDGFNFKRFETPVLPVTSGSQSTVFYDEQCQCYMTYHRSDFGATPSGSNNRHFVFNEVKNLFEPWKFTPVDQKVTLEAANKRKLRDPQPWFLDNGTLSPGGFGIEFPTMFAGDDSLDPLGTDIYVPKVTKYPWAPDTYLAFPSFYFHYEDDGPPTRQILGTEKYRGGSGPIEAQLETSREGINWKRYPRPAYVGIGVHEGRDIHMVYMVEGMVKRGNEIWQYYLGDDRYHSSYEENSMGRAVYRVIQRVDGFVSADTPYDKYGTIRIKPIIFKGNRLVLNIDTDATGYAQVELLDEKGNPIEGYSLDDCVYINGDFIDAEVEWINKGKDVSSLQGKPVQVVFRMRGTRLYEMQFLTK